MGKQKVNCEIYTPHIIVTKMLDIIGYNKNLYGRKVLENSCGEGNFLVEIVKRYVKDCKANNFTNDQICRGLEKDIYGFEINQKTLVKCKENLNKCLEYYSLPKITWNIQKDDVLKTPMCTDFSFIIGNPPYITYTALEKNERSFIRESFDVCKYGKFDYYYAFIEQALKCLNNNGKMIYLIPNNFFKTKSATILRNFILPYLFAIYDYKSKKIFEKALTSSAIVVCGKKNIKNKFCYHDQVNNKKYIIDKRLLKDKWTFNLAYDYKRSNTGLINFNEYFTASSTIATLYNSAFVINSQERNNIEKQLIRKTVSPKSISMKMRKYIIFPYYYDKKGVVQHYSENEFINLFPNAYNHLIKFKNKLDKRDSDNKAKWYEYGRSQAIAHLNQKKLLISTLVTNKVKVYELDKDTVPYSGIFIIAKPGLNLSQAKNILESEDFYDYVKSVGIHANGNTIRISISDVNNYQFTDNK